MNDIRKAHEQGHAITSALADEFTCCLAVPILDQATKQPVATVCFVVPVHTPEERRAELLGLLKASSRTISTRLGNNRFVASAR